VESLMARRHECRCHSKYFSGLPTDEPLGPVVELQDAGRTRPKVDAVSAVTGRNDGTPIWAACSGNSNSCCETPADSRVVLRSVIRSKTQCLAVNLSVFSIDAQTTSIDVPSPGSLEKSSTNIAMM